MLNLISTQKGSSIFSACFLAHGLRCFQSLLVNFLALRSVPGLVTRDANGPRLSITASLLTVARAAWQTLVLLAVRNQIGNAGSIRIVCDPLDLAQVTV
ncbi:hypothetical protein Mapa_001116 [Marchantia paleacea]|nr:hypothetical protein Mapa_001116 [Marchantia paleacea]